MTNTSIFKESPFKTQISFHKLIESLEEIALSDIDYRSQYAKSLLNEIEAFPEFKTGIDDLRVIEKNKTLIKYLLADLFPTALTKNEIKAVTIPFQNFTFNFSDRFTRILDEAGIDFDMTIRDFDEDQMYILSCILILNTYYKKNFEISKPLFYDIPTNKGIIKHYRILYNADFIEITPTPTAPNLTAADIDLLMDNYDNIELWKEKFPVESWSLKGFGILSLFDATTESAISNLKSNLLKADNETNNSDSFETIFRSIFKIPDLKVGLIMYNEEENKFTKPPFNNNQISSYILHDQEETVNCQQAFFGCSLTNLLEQQKPFTISDVAKFSNQPENEALGTHLIKQNIKSCIFAPVLKNNKLLGILELVSEQTGQLNSINANNLDLLLPYVIDTLERYNIDLKNQIEAVIQREYTAIHASVYWKFKNEAQKYFHTSSPTNQYIFKEIVFKEVYPLYGQIDIKGSSQHRNDTVKEDLKNQLQSVLTIFEHLKSSSPLSLLEQRKFEMQSYYNELEAELKADTEQQIQNYVQKEIHPILKNTRVDHDGQNLIDQYFTELDSKTGLFYHARKKFDDAMSIINKKMAYVIDKEQIEAQKIFPHYFERFKTDGVEHNLYIGATITPTQTFEMMYLNNLRLWQLQTLCKMELEHHRLKSILPYELDVTSLILVFSSPLSIRFRMDEKRFDVDGTYNARYEVVKKRIDKANIKGTQERITQKEKITIVYSHQYEEAEYLKYIKFLQFKKILEPTIEKFDIEELQGVSGLKALRIKVINTDSNNDKYTYHELLTELN
ncbi:GAF domain-containing protein [Flavobacterium muglaense]|uniref:GAF domain-containing protein n=1 Tax=Flavobacterium muglaense TaxID=2764716 RepID=A0A923SE44_9FLAO|nr:GAF domain-containing protein [Flavobacterium muglaense]MBC5836602.1 GAF domain-containing protein [Flavobacterium muglaense]MBC5843132.1 GAF domain-containing protein [Flavobacterium muglaense]